MGKLFFKSVNSTNLSKIFQCFANVFFFPRNFCDKKMGNFILFSSVNSTNVSRICQCFAKFSSFFFSLEIFVTKKIGNFTFSQFKFHLTNFF